ncbi:hypothetical protein CAY88_35660 [Pseudomonas aeruginosa]|nr:hypothetical protein CAY88_35660 [Pseudomonas aeruginosa]
MLILFCLYSSRLHRCLPLHLPRQRHEFITDRAEGLSAPVPTPDPRPLIGMDDMGMGGMDHGAMGHGAVVHAAHAHVVHADPAVSLTHLRVHEPSRHVCRTRSEKQI